eukprot:3345645-Pyramimonas_sp.AAC.1
MEGFHSSRYFTKERMAPTDSTPVSLEVEWVGRAGPSGGEMSGNRDLMSRAAVPDPLLSPTV